MLNLQFLATDASSSSSSLMMIIPMILIFALMYFMMIRPQKKQQKLEQEMRNSLKIGDEITTIGGIIGKIVSIKDETLVLETTKQRTQIRFLKGAIRNVDVKVADAAAAVVASKEDKNADKNAAPEADASKSSETADKETCKETENKD